MSEVKFLHCEDCGCVVNLLTGDCRPSCCNKPMELLVADTVDAAREKHVPDVTRDGNKISVVIGSTVHPMVEKHYITLIAAVQGEKIQVVKLHPGEEPRAVFDIDDGPVEVYEFCNLHGLWKTEA
ncbi:MAG: desulfoferrodoxin family protein [Tissierellia bacterium]|nr:desulfoferrodoxin family protein [Tissierellia bacterium]